MSTVTLPKVAVEPKRRPLHTRLLNREAPLGYALLVPTMLMLVIFLGFPFFWGIWLSVTNASIGVEETKFIGAANFLYERGDTVFIQSFWNTMNYTLVTTVFKLVLGLSMALLLNQVFPFQRFVRADRAYALTARTYRAWPRKNNAARALAV